MRRAKECLRVITQIQSKNLHARLKSTQFVPKHDPVSEEDIEKLERFLEDKPNILVLTGAGVSTESGTYFYENLSSFHLRKVSHHLFLKFFH